jgi:hypothetical protein
LAAVMAGDVSTRTMERAVPGNGNKARTSRPTRTVDLLADRVTADLLTPFAP